MRAITITLEKGIIDGFIDDKDLARGIRVDTIMVALEGDRSVIIDFRNVKTSTQSFVHALIGEVLGRYKEPVLGKIEFRHCSAQLKSLIELVVDYSLGGFLPSEDDSGNERKVKRSGKSRKCENAA